MNDEYDKRNRAEWIEAVNALFHGLPPTSASWTEIADIARALNAVCVTDSLSHTMLPDGGGQDLKRVRISCEPDCIEFDYGGSTYLCKPKVLNFEYISSHAWNSFFLLDTHPLPPTGVYKRFQGVREVILRLPDGTYMDRGFWDAECIGYDENGQEIGLPSGSKIIFRELSGKFLTVAKRSLWNLASATYHEHHTSLSPQQIRALIQQACDNLA